MADYQPGVCNIGEAEKQKRYYLGGIGFLLTAAYLLVYMQFQFPKLYLVTIFVPLMIGFEGVIQARLGFCAGFAQRGVYDVSEPGNSKEEVEDETAHKQDLMRALQIHLYSATSAIFATFVTYLLF